jgi:hypothetical protein
MELEGITWWTVMLPGEDASTSELYGMFRSEASALDLAEEWNRDASPDDRAIVKPVMPARQIAEASRR